MRDHLIQHGFRERYTPIGTGGENIEIIDNIKNIVRDE
jgi:hypothetical protein